MPTATTTSDDVFTAMLRAIADPTRRRILSMLKEPGCCSLDKSSGMCACDIEARISLSQPTISHHMAVLRDAGLIEATKIGQWMWYRRNEDAVRRLSKFFREQL
jgi:DNA-binding transcriptional ArsR family regulator